MTFITGIREAAKKLIIEMSYLTHSSHSVTHRLHVTHLLPRRVCPGESVLLGRKTEEMRVTLALDAAKRFISRRSHKTWLDVGRRVWITIVTKLSKTLFSWKLKVWGLALFCFVSTSFKFLELLKKRHYFSTHMCTILATRCDTYHYLHVHFI